MRGRKPKPAEVHEQNGNPGHRDLAMRSENEPPAKCGTPPRPMWLTKDGKKAWLYVCEHLEQMGILATCDGNALGMMCNAWGLYVESMRAVATDGAVIEGRVGKVAHPGIGIAQKQAQILMRMLPEFGLTPSGRARIAIQKGDNVNDGGIMDFIKGDGE